MAARWEPSDGTTLAMRMPSTPGESRDASAKRWRRSTPHSSAVWPCTVRSRHWLTRRRWSNAPMVLADELEADWTRVKIIQAQGDPKYGDQNTDGSRSVRQFYQPMRVAGASARLMLEAAAGHMWGVDAN